MAFSADDSRVYRSTTLYHTTGIDAPQRPVKRCHNALSGLIQSVPSQLQGHASLLAEEQPFIERSSDDYIAHGYLEGDNHARYFHEFASRLQANGLRFLCEAELASIHAHRYPQALG